MAELLPYERPRYVELRSLPPRLRKGLLLATAILAALMLIASPLLYRYAHQWAQWELIAPSIAAAVLAALSTGRSLTRVFADRLQVDLALAGLRMASLRVPWSDVVRVDATSSSSGGYKLYGTGPGFRAIMYGGVGVHLVRQGYREVFIGSAQPQALLDAITQARAESDPGPQSHDLS